MTQIARRLTRAVLIFLSFSAASFATLPSITSLSPNSGAVGLSVTITGANFGSTQGTSSVKFNGTAATPTSWSAGTIVAPVPVGATTGSVVVTVSAKASNGVTFTVAPSISSLTPSSGAAGNSITVAGSNFGSTQGSSSIKFNGTAATPSAWTSTSITAPVPAGATTGNVVVTVGALASNGATFTVAPNITGVSPSSAPVGASVTITGLNFGSSQGSSTIKFNGVAAVPTSWSGAQIIAPVPSTASTGNLVVTVGTLSSNAVTFSVLPTPSITAVSPTSGPTGAPVTITGTNFGATQGTNVVTVGGVTVTPSTWSATSIVLSVPSSLTAGSAGIVVTVSGVASNSFGFVVTPQITGVSPASGPVGASVTITGNNFGTTRGASSVTFNGTAGTPSSWNATQIVIPVPAGATSGNVVVTVNGAVSNGMSFTVLPTPSITSVSPTSAAVAASVTITGTNFGTAQGSSSVTFGGIASTPSSWSQTSIAASVPNTLTPGPAAIVVTVNAIPSNAVNFAVSPQITGLSPSSGPIGTVVTIAGNNFGSAQGASTVTVGGVSVTPTTWSSTSLAISVPSGLTPGSSGIVVTVNSASSNSSGFTVTPQISGLTPTSAAIGTSVTIAGNNFGASLGTSAVTFNGAAAAPSSWSATQIIAPVPNTATTGNVVVTVNGAASNGASFSVLATPGVSSLSPASAPVGASVTIAGSNFGSTQGSSTVTFSGTAASPANWTNTQIVAAVPAGATSGTVVVTASGVPSSSTGPSFTVLPTPAISSLSPAAGPTGTSVTISGTNFGSTQGTSAVMFGGTAAIVNSWTSTSIVAAVPSALPAGSIPLTVTLSGVASNAVSYSVTPLISAVSQLSGAAGAPITITGSNFGASQGTASVTFNGTSATASSWSATRIVVTIPAAASSGSLLVTVNGANSNGVNFTVLPPPTITGVSLSYASLTTATITGMNFGSSQGASTVTFNGTAAVATTWTDTSVIAALPIGTNGNVNVVVTAAGSPSNAFAVSVQPQPLPAGWMNQDVGAVGASGSATYSNGTFIVKGAGHSGSNADGLQFVYQSLSGDGSIVARVSTVLNSGEAGVMIRETLDPGSSNAWVYFLPNQSQFRYRSGTGANSATLVGSFTHAAYPYWVKLVRSGNSFTGYISNDAFNWSPVGTPTTIPMAQNVYIGVAVSSQNVGVLTTATFDDVSIGSTAAPAPNITALSATTASVGGQVTISGSGFGTAEGSYVSLNGSPVIINSWSDTSIVFTVPTGATSGLLMVTSSPSMNVSNPVYFEVTGQPIPSSWLDLDIGAVTAIGSATYSNGTFTLQGAGSMGGSADITHFAYQALSGDGSIIARVSSIQGGGQIGIIVRESLSPGSSDALLYFQPNQAYFLDRPSTGANTSSQVGAFVSSSYPYWVKLVRSGNIFTSYFSFDGLNWTQVGTSTTVTMARNVYVGLFVSSQTPGAVTTATFDNVSISSTADPAPTITAVSATTAAVGSQVMITGSGFGATQSGSLLMLNGTPVNVNLWSDTSIVFTVPTGATSGFLVVALAPNMDDSNPIRFAVTSQPLPNPWLDQDIGAVGSAGGATYSNGVFTVKGAGSFGGTADTAHLVYQTLTGDGSIVARVSSIQGGGQIGVTIRESLNAGSSNALVFFQPNQAYFYDRAGTNATTASQVTTFVSNSYPYWVKLIRNGNTFIAFVGRDGVNWIQVGTPTTVSMAQNVYIGLAVNAWSTGASIATATFDNVSVTVGTTPYVSSVSPLLAGIGSSVTITGSNFGDIQGTSSVSFNGTAATSITSWSSSQIVATVPSNVVPGTGPLTVTVNSIVSNSNIAFTAINPIIASVTPASAAPGGTVTLTGSGFGSNYSSSNNQVAFGGAVATMLSWSDTSATVIVPNAASGPVTVTYYGVTSNAVPFTIEGQPNVTALLPNAGPAGSSILISGSGFGASQSNSVVQFNGGTASVSNWSDTQLTVIVPPGASTGPVSVKVAGLTGQSAEFTLTSTVQVTDSAGNISAYTSLVTGGSWYMSSSQGTGCSSCTIRGVNHRGYDGAGNLLGNTDELNHTTTYTYDGSNNLASQANMLDSSTTATWGYTYNSFGEVLTATDPLGNVTTNTYDAHGNLLTVTTPAPDANTAASVTTFTYDTKGELLTITDPLNHVTTLTYTTAGLIHTITDAQNNVTTYGYDAHGNRTSVIDAMQHETDFAYDAGDRLTTITYPSTPATTSSFGYDARGRRTSVTDQNGKVTTYAYDDADRLTSVTDAAQHVTSYAYDDENNLLSITDANNHMTSFGYDNFGRVKETDFPSGKAETYTYDEIGNLLEKTDRNGNALTYVYDALNRLTHKGYPDGTGVDYIYDLVGKIKQATDPTGTYGFAYDNMGRLIGTTTQYAFLPGNTYSNAYTYDAASNRTGFTAPDGSTNTYAYDSLNRLQTLTNSATGQFGFGYDALSRRTSLTRPNNVSTSYSYDSLSRLLSILHQTGGATIDGASYTLDNSGNRVSKLNQLSGVTENYSYDPTYQLTQVQQLVNGNTNTSESYSYDGVGNRLSSLNVASYTYNNSNELASSSDGYTYTYDSNGNPLTKANSTGMTQYAWDFENRLASVTLPNGGGLVAFKYDPVGRRVQKSGPSGTTNYLYGEDAILEEIDSAGNVIGQYTQGADTDEHLSILRLAGTGYYSQDGLGSVTSLSSSAGSLANTYTYDSFGKLTASSGTLINPFRYTGREFDLETGLYYNRARYYDPNTGRFLSEDPAGFIAGPNFYDYVWNQPIVYSDPTGLNPAVGVLPWLGGLGGEGAAAAGAAGAGAGAAVVGAGVVGWGIGRGIGHIPVGDGHTVDDSITDAITWTILWSRGRGHSDPYPTPAPFNPGREPCDKGKGPCKPCPPPTLAWPQLGNRHGATVGYHYHWIEWHQDPATCMCYPKRMSGGF